MLLSGGTTSMSKLIPRTHQDYVLNARLCGRAAGFDEDTVFMAILPLGHNYNLASPGLLATLHYGGTVVLARVDADRRHLRHRAARARHAHRRGGAADRHLAGQRRGDALRPVVAEGGAERRRTAGAGAAAAAARALRLHAAGDLRHRRRPDQHDAAGRCRRAAAAQLRRAGVRGRRDPRARRRGPRAARRRARRAGDARPLHHPRLLRRGRKERRGLHRRRLLPHGRHRAQARPPRLRRGPAQGLHQPRRREDQLRGNREPDVRPPEGQGRRAGGHARCGVRREGLCLRRAAPGPDAWASTS